MTWLKLGEEFPIELAKLKLSDAAFRTHVEGLSYALDRETDGVLADSEVRRFAETADYSAAVQELVDHGLWTRTDGGFRIVHHMEHQPTAAYLEDQRSNAARRKQREREKKALLAAGRTEDEADAILEQRGLAPKSSKSTSHRDSPRDPQRDNTSDPDVTGRVTRNGAERSGTDAFNTSTSNLSAGSEIEMSADRQHDFTQAVTEPVTRDIYPIDPEAVRRRQKIEENNIGSVEELMEFMPMTRAQAEKIWADAFPVGAVV